MRKLVLVLRVGAAPRSSFAAVSLGAPARAWAGRAKLTAAQEIPKQAVKAPAAHGAFTATLSGTTLTWKLTFAKLSGPRDRRRTSISARWARPATCSSRSAARARAA